MDPPENLSIRGRHLTTYNKYTTTPVSILAVFTGSHHEYTLSKPRSVARTDSIWLDLTDSIWKLCLSPMEGARPQVSSTPGKSVYWPFLLDQAVSYTLSPYILLLSMSFPPCFNIGLDGFSVTVFFQKKRTTYAYVANMVRCHHPRHNSITWASISTATWGATPHVEPCRDALRLLRHVRRHVSNDFFRSLVVSIVHSWLDYGDFLFVGLPAYLQRRSSFDIPISSLRPRVWRTHNTALAAFARTGQFQTGAYGIPSVERYVVIVSEQTCFCI